MNKGTKCTFLPNAVPTVRTDNWTWASVARTKAHTAPLHTREGSLCAALHGLTRSRRYVA